MRLALRDIVPGDDMVEYPIEKLPVSLRLELEVPPVGTSSYAARNLGGVEVLKKSLYPRH